MKKKLIALLPFIIILLCVGIFFKNTILKGTLPVPTDTLVGMYHPWLDAIAKDYPSGMPYKNFLITDPIRQQIPWRKQSIESIRQGNVHPWNPYIFSGTPLFTNIQSGFFYPLNFLFFMFSFPIAWTILIMLQPLLAGIFMYVFLNKSIRLSFYASLFGSVGFMFCGFMTVWLTWGIINQTLLWLPLLLFLCDALFDEHSHKKRIGLGLFIGFILAVQYFAGHSQVFLYSSVVFVLYATYRLLTNTISHALKKSVMISLLFGIGFGIVCTSFHWWPFMSDFQNITRLKGNETLTAEGFFIPIQNLVQFIAPDFFGNPATLNYWGIWNYAEFSGYIGIAGFLFALYSIFSNRRKDVVFWIILVVSSFLMAMPSFLAQIPYTLKIPVLSSLQPTRLLSIIDFGLCILAAIGFEEWHQRAGKKQSIIILGVFAVLFGFLWFTVKANPYGISKELLDVSVRNSIFPTVIFSLVGLAVLLKILTLLFDKKYHAFLSGALSLGVIGILLFDLIRFGWKFTPFTDSKLFFPKTEIISFLENQQKPFRISSVDDRVMPPNVNGYYGIETIAGYDPLYNSRYETFIAAMERGEANITPPYGFNRIITPKNFQSTLFRLLGVRYVLSLSDIEDMHLKKIMQEGQTRIYEYTNSVDRVYLAENVIVENDEARIFSTLYSKDFRIGKDVIAENNPGITSQQLTGDEKSTITSYQNNAMTIEVKSDIKRLLSVGSVYDRRWKAYIDGSETPIYKINYIFMGIVVPEGTHTVEFIFR